MELHARSWPAGELGRDPSLLLGIPWLHVLVPKPQLAEGCRVAQGSSQSSIKLGFQ